MEISKYMARLISASCHKETQRITNNIYICGINYRQISKQTKPHWTTM